MIGNIDNPYNILSPNGRPGPFGVRSDGSQGIVGSEDSDSRGTTTGAPTTEPGHAGHEHPQTDRYEPRGVETNISADNGRGETEAAGREPAEETGRIPADEEAAASEQPVGADNQSGETEEAGRTQAPEADEEPGPKDESDLSDEEKAELAELKAADQKVRAHEMAHLAAAGGIAVSGASFQYQRGPDGVNYAVGGEVQIDTSKESSPEATVAKAQKVSAAATAPADPSAQDRKVAAQARKMEADARAELAKESQKETRETDNEPDESAAVGETETTGPAKTGRTGTRAAEGTGLGDTESEPSGMRVVDDERRHPGIESYIKNQQSYNNATGAMLPPMLDLVA